VHAQFKVHFMSTFLDAYFWIGRSVDPSPSGVIVPYPDDHTDREPPILRDFTRENVILDLPPSYKIKDIAWLSVWCRKFTVNFGDIKVPQNMQVPTPKVLSEFEGRAHGLRSGNITILDSKTFFIPNLQYDGAGPDTFFWVGTGNQPHTRGRQIANENGSLEVLNKYEGEDIELKLPDDLTVFDIDWLSVWCVAYKQDFGHVKIPRDDLNVPPSLDRFRIRKVSKNMYMPQGLLQAQEFCRGILRRKRVIGMLLDVSRLFYYAHLCSLVGWWWYGM